MTETVLRTNYALLLFYVREKYWHHAEEVCTSTIQATDDHMFRVWRAMTLDRQGMANEALREYKAVESRRPVAVPALMGMYLIYKQNRDQEGVSQTERKLEGLEVADNMGGWVQAAALCWAAGDINAARDILLKFTDTTAAMAYRDDYTNFGTIRAWVDLLSGRAALLEKAGAVFSNMLEMEEAQYSFFPTGADSTGTGGVGGGGSTKWTDMNAALGYVTFLERKMQFTKAQSLLDRLVVLYPNCSIPPLVCKARLLMRAEDWEQAIEVTRRILTSNKDNVEALALEALYALVRDTRYDAAAVRLRRLLEAVREKEPRNVQLLHQFALVFSRLAGDRLDLLNITTQFSEMGCALDGRNGDVLCGLGYQQLYRHDVKAAIATFQKASTLTDSLSPLLGTVACLIHQGDLEEAAAQLKFCNELQPATQRNAELLLLNARLRWKQNRTEEEAAMLRLLEQGAEAIRHDVEALAGGGMEVYVSLNAPVALQIARLFLMYCRNEPPDPMFKMTDLVGERCCRHLAFVVQHLPACMEAQLMLAKALFITGEVRKAQTLIMNTLIVQEQPLPESFLLSSQICQYMGDVKLAMRALEQALTLDFSLQEQPLYNLLLGTVQSTAGKPAESLASLKRAYDIVKEGTTTSISGKPMQPLSIPEQVTLYLQLAQAHLRMRDVDAARSTLTEAAIAFRDTAQAGRVVIAQAMLAARTDVDKSIELLRQVSSKSEYYIAARSQLGKLFLTQKHNIVLYIQTFQEMVEAVPSPQSYVALGEAYTAIQEPEQAVAAYEKAKVLSPSSSELSVRVGRALVAAHDYAKAIRYYTEALSSDPHLSTVRADLATLHWRLGQIDEARETLTHSPVYELAAGGAGAAAEEAVSTAVERINIYLLLYKVLRDQTWTVTSTERRSDETTSTKADGMNNNSDGDAALTALLTAHSLQKRLLDYQLRGEPVDVVAEQRSIMAGICAEIGDRCLHSLPATPSPTVTGSDKKVEAAAALAIQSAIAVRLTQAREYLKEALSYDESHEQAQLASAQLCLRTGDVDGCERHCLMVMRMVGESRSSEEAATMLANLYTQRGRADDAQMLFEGMLEKSPTHYEALVHYIVLLYRTGSVTDAKEALERAAATISTGQRVDPGLSYARGLYQHLCNNPAEALRHFHQARLPADNPWCTRALVRMIWIYLIPTTQDLWVRASVPELDSSLLRRHSTSSSHKTVTPQVDQLQQNIRFAEQLLLQLTPQSEERRILQAYCTMATRCPDDVETAMHLFLECIAVAESTSSDRGEKAKDSISETAPPRKTSLPSTQTSPDVEEDEDARLLADMHTAAAQFAQRHSKQSTTTLAFALQCKTIHPSAFLGLAICLFLSDQEAAARNVLGRLLESKGVLTTVAAATEAAATAAATPAAAQGNGGASSKMKNASSVDGASAAAPTAVVTDPDHPGQVVMPPPTALLMCAEDDTIERAMRLQAHMDTQSHQYGDARFILRQVLAANEGNGAVWDELGMVYEQQRKYKDASQCYEKAWELLRESDPAVGYKLGFNYLRGSQPVKAIDVCKSVLAHHPTYPRIDEDVMDVAYSMLRP